MRIRSLDAGRSNVLLLFCLVFAANASAEATHPFQVSDLFRLEQLGGEASWFGGPTFSPDGHSCIFEHIRPFNSVSDVNGGPAWLGLSRSDLWLVREGETKPLNLTEGESDGSGSWKSFWSPDNQRVAFYSTKGTSNWDIRPRLWLWESASGQSRRLSDRTITESGDSVWWMGPTHLLCNTLYDSEWKRVEESLRATKWAADLWSNIWSAKTATVNIIESGITNDARTNWSPYNVLVMIDTTTGKETTLDEGLFYYATVSPDGSRAAVLKDFDRNQSLIRSYFKSLDGNELNGYFQIVANDGRVLLTPHLSNITVASATFPAWSPDGGKFAFIGMEHGKESTTHALMVYDVARDQASLVSCPGLEPDGTNKLYWLADGKLVLRAKATEAGPTNTGRPSWPDWWLIAPGAAPKSLTAGFTNGVDLADFFHHAGQNEFICRAEDAVWRIYLDGRLRQKLTASITNTIQSLVLPIHPGKWGIMSRQVDFEAPASFVLDCQSGPTSAYFWMDSASGQCRPIPKPSSGAYLADYVPGTATGLFVENGATGSRVWMGTLNGKGTASLLTEANGFLAEILAGEQRLIEYQSLDGKPLKGWLLLPVHFESGKKYPMVAWVYAGSEFTSSKEPTLGKLNRDGQLSPFNFQLLASRGYAVLFPSMPLKPDGQADDPLLELTKGVLPAVDKAVELGIADSDRIGVMGQSFGGYSTMGLVTQTRRFKAAVSLAGDCDLISTYGTFGGSVRYKSDPNREGGDFAQLWSMGQGRLMNPPWKDLGRYLRNSPITYVDRVETPFLIIQGDMDFVPIQQGEEFFQALYKQGKRAEFARYWGEGHVFVNPANVEDMWDRIFNWFDTYLKK
jgi:dipeptidyl aminopeptidase/acylaminoacyl peptidase